MNKTASTQPFINPRDTWVRFERLDTMIEAATAIVRNDDPTVSLDECQLFVAKEVSVFHRGSMSFIRMYDDLPENAALVLLDDEDRFYYYCPLEEQPGTEFSEQGDWLCFATLESLIDAAAECIKNFYPSHPYNLGEHICGDIEVFHQRYLGVDDRYEGINGNALVLIDEEACIAFYCPQSS